MTEPGRPDTGPARLHDGIWAKTTMFRNARARAYQLCTDRSLFAKGIRFAFVGAVSGLIFAATTALLISGFGLDQKLSSIAGYMVSMPVNFFANRSFSFHSQGSVWSEVVRYACLHIVNMAVTAGTMGASVNALGLHYSFGIIGAIILVPLANFILMNVWVFDAQVRPETDSNLPR